MTNEIRATLYRTEDGVPSIDSLWPRSESTPGNVGVAFSGGGSRAMTCAVGQLRALATLTANGRSLLSQVKAISAVSGGAWASVPFVCADPGLTDEELLGRYVGDPSRLVPVEEEASAPEEHLGTLPEGGLMRVPAKPEFSAPSLIFSLMMLIERHGVSSREAWQRVVGMHLLQPYGLYDPEADPDRQPGFEVTQAGAPGRAPRPFLIVNTSLFVQHAEDPSIEERVSFPITPRYAGVLGSPPARDTNGRLVGGGAVSTSALNLPLRDLPPRAPLSPDIKEEAPLGQGRSFRLYEILGCTSAFFALYAQKAALLWMENEEAFAEMVREEAPKFAGFLRASWPSEVPVLPIEELLRKLPNAPRPLRHKIVAPLSDLVPELRYWSPRDPQVGPLRPTHLADGGAIENTGVASLLAYPDIERVIAFVNAPKGVRSTDRGVLDAEGEPLGGSSIHLESQIPPLFGYQPWREGIGYRLYAGDPEPEASEFARNQVFPSEFFAPLLAAVEASWRGGRGAAMGAIEVPVLANEWLGVPARERPVTLLLFALSGVGEWEEQLRPEVRLLLGDSAEGSTFMGFPNMGTGHTYMDTGTLNLLAHLSCWCVADPRYAPHFQHLFEV